jgi:hypothetical protein
MIIRRVSVPLPTRVFNENVTAHMPMVLAISAYLKGLKLYNATIGEQGTVVKNHLELGYTTRISKITPISATNITVDFDIVLQVTGKPSSDNAPLSERSGAVYDARQKLPKLIQSKFMVEEVLVLDHPNSPIMKGDKHAILLSVHFA